MRQSRREFMKMTAVTTAALLAGCVAPPSAPQPGAGTTGEGDASAEAPITLTMLSWHFNEEGLDLFENQFVPPFQEMHPNITLEFIATDSNRINDQLLTSFAAGQGPDLWEHGSSASGAGWAASGQALALDDYWATYERADDYLENAVATAYLDGKLYSIPRMMNPDSLLYRKDFFAEAGLDPEVGPETWEEHLEMAQALTVRENGTVVRAGHAVPTQGFGGIQQGWWPFLHQNGASILNEEMTAVAFDSPEGIEAIQWYHDLLWVHELDVLGGIATGLTGHPVNIGTAAMGYGGTSALIEAENNFPEVYENHLGVFLSPSRARRAALLAIDRIFLSKDGDTDAAWAWLTYLHQPDNLTTRFQVQGHMPPTRSFIASDIVAEKPLLQQLLQAAEVGVQWPPSPKWNEFRSFVPSMSEALMTDAGPVEPVVRQFAGEINAILSS